MASIFRRGKTWWIAYLVNGRKTQHSLKTTDERVARYRKAEIEKALAERRRPPQLRTHLLKKTVEEYLASCQSRQTRRSFVTTKGRLLHLINTLPVQYLDEVTTAQIQDYLDRRVQGKEIGRKTANHIRTAIMAFFNHCLKYEYCSRNPVLAVQRFKLPKIPSRYLLWEEIERLLEAAKTYYKGRYYPMVATAIYTGLRLGELFALQWDDIDFERKTIMVKDKPRLGLRTKDADFRVIPIHSRLLTILESARKPVGFCFFPSKQVRHTTSDSNRHFKDLLRKAGLPPQEINWLALRRTFGSHSVQGGIDLSRVQDWMGHSDPRITREHYAHLQKGYDPAIERFGGSSAG